MALLHQESSDCRDVLSSADKLISNAENHLKRVKFCKHQCRYLIQELSRLLKELHLHENSLSVQALREVFYVMKKGCHLVQSCANKEWLWFAILKEENKTGFHDLFQDITKSITYLLPALQWEWEEELNNSAILDRKELSCLAKRSWRQLSGKKKVCLRNFLFDLLSSPPTDDRDQIPLPDQHIYLFLKPQHLESVKLIGGGAYGKVFEAKWLGKSVAVKEYSSHDKSFMREVTALIFLRHPNIVRMVGYSRNTKIAPYSLIMERMKRDLHHLIIDIVKKNPGSPPFPLEVALDILWQISKGMNYLHEQDVFHRDLKTANILVNLPSPGSGDFYTCKISDFGLAKTKFLSATTKQQTQRAGTVIYMAPEVWQGKRKYTKKADVYSFAMTGYEVLTGKVPFEDEGFTSADAFFKKVAEDNMRPRLPSDFPVYLASLLRCCWHGNASMRPSFAQISECIGYLKNNPPPLVNGSLNSREFAGILSLGTEPSASFRDCHRSAIAALETLKEEIQAHAEEGEGANGLADYENEVIRSIVELQKVYGDLA